MAEKPSPPTPPSNFQPMGAMKIVRAFTPGDVVFIEVARPMRVEAMEHIHAQFKKLIPDLRVVILQDGLRVASREEAEPWTDLIAKWRSMLDGAPVDSGAFEVATAMDQILKGTPA